jgi:hypothetical protein
VHDPRAPNMITSPLVGLLFIGLLMYLCRLGARRQIGLLLRNGACQQNFEALFQVSTCPHGDTLNDAFCKLNPEEMQEVVSASIKALIRKKVLYACRLLDTYFVIAIDGTGTLAFSERHCPYCLTQTRQGQTIYYHNVLEAKLVAPQGFALSVMTEFIENSDEEATRQDCELKAFYRLARRLKEYFPRLRILLTLDGLFANGPTFDICESYGWKYMIVLKDKHLASINEEFAALSLLQPENRLFQKVGRQLEVKQAFQWVSDISYLDSRDREHTLSVIQCLETKATQQGEEKTTKFKWVTNCRVEQDNVSSLADYGGRIRWKIENEGFNVQKTGGYGLEHAYTNNPTSAKVFYLLLQLAHNLAQLLQKSSLLKTVCRHGFGSGKNLAFRLLEAWRNATLTARMLERILSSRAQIRFYLDTS